jgi:phage virion morphogenesis protein
MIEIEVKDESVGEGLTALEKALSKAEPLMREIAGILADETEENFAAEGFRPGKWGDIKDGTKLARAKIGKWPGKLLQVSGKLASSITTDYGTDFAVIGSNLPYAGILHLGGKTSAHEIRAKNKKALAFGGKFYKKVNHPGSDIPARPYLPIDKDGNLQPSAQEEIVNAINDYLSNLVD